MSVQRAGTDIGALRELEVFLLVEAFRLGELKRTLVMGGTTRWHFPVTRARPPGTCSAGTASSREGEQQGR
jgi:hypothetical protein